MTFEFRTLSQAASFGAPAASTSACIAIQREMVANKLIEYGGFKQNSTTPRYYITALGMERLEELKAAAR